MTVGDILRHIRHQRGMSARSLSTAAGLSDSVASKVETDSVDPSLGTFARLVLQLGLNDREIAFLVRLAVPDAADEIRAPVSQTVHTAP